VPEELGNFAILLGCGYPKRRAFAYNITANATGVVGALLGFFTIHRLAAVVPYALAASAASFLYIAMADLIPCLRWSGFRSVCSNSAWLLTGLLTILLLGAIGSP
jgi:zinc and cadmium transporter